MMLPNEPPPPPLVLSGGEEVKDEGPVGAFTEQLEEVKAGEDESAAEASNVDKPLVEHKREGSAQLSESADVPEMLLDAPDDGIVAPKPVLAQVNGTPPALIPTPAPEPAPASDPAPPVPDPAPVSPALDPAPAVSDSTPAAQDTIPSIPNVAPPDPSTRSPLPHIDPISPSETIHTETAYHSADSLPPSPGDPSS